MAKLDKQCLGLMKARKVKIFDIEDVPRVTFSDAGSKWQTAKEIFICKEEDETESPYKKPL